MTPEIKQIITDERLKRELPHYLNPGARIFFEIGASQGEALKKLFPEGEIQADWAGHPRFYSFEK